MTETKKALLVVSFGTSYDSAREKSINSVEKTLEAAFPDFDLHVAMSSHFLLRKLRRQGMDVYAIPEALTKLHEEGYQEVLIQALHIIKGFEFEKITDAVDRVAGQFTRIWIGQPLLASSNDYGRVAEGLMPLVKTLAHDEAMVFMGHGSAHNANQAYTHILEALLAKGLDRVWMATVEGEPVLEDILPELKQKDIRKVHLMPFMLVAGDHAHNDMAGEDEDSWKSILLREGFEVETHLAGLGEIEAIRRIYVDHARQALERA